MTREQLLELHVDLSTEATPAGTCPHGKILMVCADIPELKKDKSRFVFFSDVVRRGFTLNRVEVEAFRMDPNFTSCPECRSKRLAVR